MAQHDDDYYRRRAEEERQRARASQEPSVAKAHSLLANLYEQRIADPTAAYVQWTEDSD